uniref:Uncharacterized protein n=1 Tax=Arundo donax TaxID=35708 RepID=A0A0A9HDF2_ARUDO
MDREATSGSMQVHNSQGTSDLHIKPISHKGVRGSHGDGVWQVRGNNTHMVCFLFSFSPVLHQPL